MQKELLDTELDLYKKMQAGEEVTELRRKYTELQLEVCFIITTQYTEDEQLWSWMFIWKYILILVSSLWQSLENILEVDIRKKEEVSKFF